MEPTDPYDPLVNAAERLTAEIEAVAGVGDRPERDCAALEERVAILVADVAARLRRVRADMADDRFAVLVLELARAELRDEDRRGRES